MRLFIAKSKSIALPALAVIAVVCVVALAFQPDMVLSGKWSYPKAEKQDVVEDYHGKKVADPYRWLEDPESEQTLEWVNAENELTRKYVDTEAREIIKARMTELWNFPRYSVPEKEGKRYFYTKNDGLQNQAVLYMQKSLDAEPVVLLDPNKLSEDGTVALRSERYNTDGTLMAYALSASGSDWQEIHVRNTDTREDTGDLLKWCKFSGIGWTKDSKGFYYNRFPDPSTVAEEDQNNFNKVYWHELGTPQSDDALVYEDENKELGFWPYTTEDGKYLVLYVYHGTDDRNGIYLRKTADKGDFLKLTMVGEAKFDPIDNIGSTFYFVTDLDAPRGRVIAVDMSKPQRENWREIIPQSENVVAFATMVADQFVVGYMKDAHHELEIFDKKGKHVNGIDLPTIGSVSGLSGKREDKEMFFGFTSYLYPYTVFRYDFKSKDLSVFRAPEVDFDASKYETQQVFFESKDGTRVPMFVTHKKGLKLNGQNPAVLYGYGGFNISMTPYFSISRLVWLENGGVFVVANLRGGDEYGEEWHQQGMLENKQNVFDDFIAAGEYLIDKGYTSKEKLAIEGGSNGGLLVAACMVQRPELYGAVVCRVPVIDMLRYHKFTVGRYWTPEYGNAEENPEHFDFMYAYSPLHNVKEGTTYPPTLITSADTDDRVVPMHAKKFAAELQAKDAGVNPILIRIETKAGHGGGKPTTKIIDEQSDIYGFLFRTFGMQPTMAEKSNL